MSELAIQVRGLGKRFHLGEGVSARRLLKNVKRRLASPFRRPPEDPSHFFWALRDVDFEVKRGEVIGIIGHNGAGKSTLLKILSRITEPTEGTIEVYGRVASLLEVGTGFHPELTGRENIYLNGAILGMSTAEINSKFEEIVEFAEVARFLDTPVKRYSSGMRVRLGFAVAAHLEPEILVVDEVLSVGDASFQRKCLGKMGEVAGHGRTVLFVSHNMPSVRTLCQRVICLKAGRVIDEGDAAGVVERYVEATNQILVSDAPEMAWEESSAPGNWPLRLRAIQLRNSVGAVKSAFSPQEPVTVRITYELAEALPGFRLVLQLCTGDGQPAFTSTDESQRHHGDLEELSEPGTYVSECTIPGHLLNEDQYRVLLWAGSPGRHDRRRLLEPTEFLSVTVAGLTNSGALNLAARRWAGVVCPRLQWRVERRALTGVS